MTLLQFGGCYPWAIDSGSLSRCICVNWRDQYTERIIIKKKRSNMVKHGSRESSLTKLRAATLFIVCVAFNMDFNRMLLCWLLSTVILYCGQKCLGKHEKVIIVYLSCFFLLSYLCNLYLFLGSNHAVVWARRWC